MRLYTPAADADGTVKRAVVDALAFPHPQTPDGFLGQLDAFMDYDALDRLAGIDAPTLVLAGELDIAAPPRLGRLVAEQVANAEFETLPGQAHRPFEETRTTSTHASTRSGETSPQAILDAPTSAAPGSPRPTPGDVIRRPVDGERN